MAYLLQPHNTVFTDGQAQLMYLLDKLLHWSIWPCAQQLPGLKWPLQTPHNAHSVQNVTSAVCRVSKSRRTFNQVETTAGDCSSCSAMWSRSESDSAQNRRMACVWAACSPCTWPCPEYSNRQQHADPG